MMINLAMCWFECKLLETCTMKETAHVFNNLWLCRYPRPKVVVIDEGPEFKSEFI